MGHNRAGDAARVKLRRRRREMKRLAKKDAPAVPVKSATAEGAAKT